MTLHIENDGPRLVRTDYWQSEHARHGMLYLSTNAGVLRLLAPAAVAEPVVAGLTTARLVIISWGWWPQERREGIEILADDGSDRPWAAHLDARQADRRPAPTDAARAWTCAVWMPDPAQPEGAQCVLERPARVRYVDRIPCLRPWRESRDARPRP